MWYKISVTIDSKSYFLPLNKGSRICIKKLFRNQLLKVSVPSDKMSLFRTPRYAVNLHVRRREYFCMKGRVTGLTEWNVAHITDYIGPFFLVSRTAIVAPPISFYSFRIVFEPLTFFDDVLQFLMTEFRKKSN